MAKKQTPRPRASYDFGIMQKNDLLRIRVPDSDPRAGLRALTAAYAYGRRNNQKFCGAHSTTRSGNRSMTIRRVK